MYGTRSSEKPEFGGKLPNKYKNKRNTAVAKIMLSSAFQRYRPKSSSDVGQHFVIDFFMIDPVKKFLWLFNENGNYFYDIT